VAGIARENVNRVLRDWANRSAHLAHGRSLCWHPVPPLDSQRSGSESASRGAPTPGEIIPEWWATSSRKGGRDHLGMGGRHHPGMTGGLLRNRQSPSQDAQVFSICPHNRGTMKGVASATATIAKANTSSMACLPSAEPGLRRRLTGGNHRASQPRTARTGGSASPLVRNSARVALVLPFRFQNGVFPSRR
jgi:hypothetical protein